MKEYHAHDYSCHPADPLAVGVQLAYWRSADPSSSGGCTLCFSLQPDFGTAQRSLIRDTARMFRRWRSEFRKVVIFAQFLGAHLRHSVGEALRRSFPRACCGGGTRAGLKRRQSRNKSSSSRKGRPRDCLGGHGYSGSAQGARNADRYPYRKWAHSNAIQATDQAILANRSKKKTTSA